MRRITEMHLGMLIDYRGFPATVVCLWSPESGGKPGGIPEPYGMEVEWTDENGTDQRTRIVLPILSAPEQGSLDLMAEEDRSLFLSSKLAEDIENTVFSEILV